MKKSLLFFLFALMISQAILAQTEVSGGIFTPTTWTATASPYVVTSDVVVFPDGSLTIEPGVEIKFNPDTRLELREGDLSAIGTDTAPIIFTVNDTTGTGLATWNGIENTTITNDSVGIALDYVIIEHAETGLNYGSGYAYRSIDNSIFRFNDRGVFDGAQGYNWVTISDTEFLENGVGMEGRMSAINCTFTDNGVGFGNPMTFNNIDSGGRVTNCTFTNNGLAVGYISNIVNIAVIENSTFIDNERGFDGYWAIVDSSTFSGSTDRGIGVSKGDIQNSVFSNNAIGVNVNLNFQLSITNNSFNANNVALQVEGPGANIQENFFCTSTDQAVVLTTDQPIDLNNNCWCTNDLTAIADMITDAFDDVSLGIVSYDQLGPNCSIAGLVYPGDADNNGSANAWDLLQIGLAYGLEGPARSNNSFDWFGQPASDWSHTFSNNVNAKHADSNGDGIVNEDDITAINLNYNQQHLEPITHQPVVNNNNTYTLSLNTPDTLIAGQPITIDIMLADAGQPIDDLYGIAFAIEASESFLEPGTFFMNVSDSWMGDTGNLMEMSHEFPDDDRIEVAMVKNDNQPSSGYGKIASFTFVMSEDIIVSITETENEEFLSFSIVDIQTISSQGIDLTVSGEEVDVVVTSTKDVSKEISNAISTYPNPVRDILFVNAEGMTIEKIKLLNTMGQFLKMWENEGIYEISTDGLRSGIYFLEVQTDAGVGVKRIVVE
ncbi:MAG: T9SS type A sorting domain-containing protein [Bacteroidota bacterium]